MTTFTIRSNGSVVCHNARGFAALERFAAQRVGADEARALRGAAAQASRKGIFEARVDLGTRSYTLTIGRFE